MAYADITTQDPNPIKRWLQRRRFSDAVAVLRDRRTEARPRVLDFGAGDGELIRQLVGTAPIEAWAYEPTPGLAADARAKLAGLESVTVVEHLDSIGSRRFDYVFCLEVFEHLPEQQTVQALSAIQRLLKPSGLAVIGVPCELYLPALLKGIFRISRRYGDFDANFRNVFAALRGRPPAARPVAEIAPGHPYHFHHLGFDQRALERLLRARFQLLAKRFSPVPFLGAGFNSEVYFVLRNGPPAPGAEAGAAAPGAAD
jgi:SAM-dependent methyltransferase